MKTLTSKILLPQSLLRTADYKPQKHCSNEIIFSCGGFMEGMGNVYQAEDLVLIRTYAFMVGSDTANRTALYLFKDKDNNLGYLINIYGYKSNYGNAFNEFLKRIPVSDQEVIS